MLYIKIKRGILKKHKNMFCSIITNCELKLKESFNDVHCSYQLLPQNYLDQSLQDITAFKSAIAAYLLSITVFIDALENFRNKNFRMFDSLIGNNSCYLVAYLIYEISNKMDNSSNFINEMEKTIKNLYILKNNIIDNYMSLNLNNFNIDISNFLEFLKRNNLIIFCEIDFFYLCQTYACTITKEKNENEYEQINENFLFEKYQNIGGIEIKKKTIHKLLKHWQKSLSTTNVKKLQEASKSLPKKHLETVQYLFSPHILKDSRDRLCTPSLFAQLVIFELLLRLQNSLIGLQVNLIQSPKNYQTRFTLFYEVQKDLTLKVLSDTKIDPDRAIYMYIGCRYTENTYSSESIENLKKTFSKRNLKDIIFAHEVTYPQYPKCLKAPNIYPESGSLSQLITYWRSLSGFSLDDPSDLCLVHIFVDNTKMQLCSIEEPPVYLPSF